MSHRTHKPEDRVIKSRSGWRPRLLARQMGVSCPVCAGPVQFGKLAQTCLTDKDAYGANKRPNCEMRFDLTPRRQSLRALTSLWVVAVHCRTSGDICPCSRVFGCQSAHICGSIGNGRGLSLIGRQRTTVPSAHSHARQTLWHSTAGNGQECFAHSALGGSKTGRQIAKMALF